MSALFNNTHEALTFAFNFSSQQYALSPMAKLALQGAGRGAGANIGNGKGLVALDGAAQAGMIMAQVERLSSLHRSCIVARYAIKSRECACCGHMGPSEPYRAAKSTAHDQKAKIWKWLKEVDAAAQRDIDDRLVSAGVCAVEEVVS